MTARRVLLAVLAALAPLAAAGDFSSDYEKALAALQRGQAAAAVRLLQSAVAQRAQPGDNVLTYGTNRLPKYHPYLLLAEAHLQLGQVAEAERALAASERYGKEPAAARDQLRARLQRAQQAAQATPPPTPVPATPEPRPVVAAATPTPAPAATPTPAPAPTVAPTPAPAVVQVRPTERPASLAASAAPAVTMPSTTMPAETATVEPGSLAVVSDPPGASVYLDDEPLGVTDPQSGRLFKSGLAPGRHRLRLARADHQDWTTEVDVEPGSLQTVRGALTVAPSKLPLGGIAAAVAGLLAVVGGLLLARKRQATAAGPVTPASTVAPTALLPQRPAAPQATPSRTPRTRRPAVTVARDAETAALGAGLPAGAEAFGAYVLLDQLGRGGMASVHRAQRNGETCALKRPLPGFVEDEEFLERFLREAEIGRTLHHPNIIRIHDRGDVDGVPYFTMELVAGETLHALLKRHGAFGPREATTIVAQVAEALDYAHLKGVVHRDLKPSNIMMLEDGTVKVMDYGIARARRFEGLTVTGAFLGTPEYVAPETAAGRGTDARSDLYALGVVFYELLTGRRPFSGETAFATIQKHCTEPPTPPSVVNPGTPRELEAVILKLLQKNPDDRYPDAEALLLDLRDYLNRSAA